MRKLFALVLVVSLTLTGCISVVDGVPKEEYDALKEAYDRVVAERDALLNGDDAPPTTESTPAPVGKFDSDAVVSQLKVTEYSHKSDWSHYHFFEIENGSEFDLEISIAVKFYNGVGELVGAQSDDERAFEHGQKILFYFMPDEEYTKTEYEITVAEETFYSCVVSNLSYESVPAKEKEIVSVTNNGEEAAEFVECSALFFKNGEVVDFDWTYFVDDNDELKPGKTISKEIDCYEEYDSVKFFFTGRSS